MRIGAFIPQGWRLDLADIPPGDHWSTMLGVAHTLESSGFSSLWVYDHFHTVPEPTQEPMYEAWSLMAALAVSTESIRLGQMCTSVGYRAPSYLAKVAASLDVLSAGRVEVGIGAGWYEHEYLGYGFPFPGPGTRIGQLAEAVEILRRMWTEDEVHHRGEHWTLEGAICSPKPAQRPHPPLWIAGGGERKTLRVAARHADATNFGGTLEAFTHKSRVLADHCREVGTDFDRIVRSANFNVVCAATEAEVEDRLDWIEARYSRVAGADHGARQRASFEKFAGTPDQLVERLAPWRDAGLSYLICYLPETAFDTTALELLGREVAPAL